VRNLLSILILFGISMLNTGCVAIFAAGAISGAAQYVKYSLDNIAHRTFCGNLDYLTTASLDALKRMNIHVSGVKKHDAGAKIFAIADDLDIVITLDPISTNATKISIDACKYAVIKDKATASEIISQIDALLTDQQILIGKRVL